MDRLLSEVAPQLTSFEMPKLNTIKPQYREFFKLLMEKVKMYRDMDLEWLTLQASDFRNKIECSQILRHLQRMILYIF